MFSSICMILLIIPFYNCSIKLIFLSQHHNKSETFWYINPESRKYVSKEFFHLGNISVNAHTKVMKCSILMLILSTLRKNVFFATEPGMMKVEIVKLAEDREMYSLPSLQEYVIYAVGQGTLK